MPLNPSTPSVTSRAVVEALVLYHLNPLLVGRQESLKRLEYAREAENLRAIKLEEMILSVLEAAYGDALNLLRCTLADEGAIQ